MCVGGGGGGSLPRPHSDAVTQRAALAEGIPRDGLPT